MERKSGKTTRVKVEMYNHTIEVHTITNAALVQHEDGSFTLYGDNGHYVIRVTPKGEGDS